MQWTLAALYRFTDLPDHAEWAARLRAHGEHWQLRGTLILAPEGINGTIAGGQDAIAATVDLLRADPRLGDLEVKYATCDLRPFSFFKVRQKAEIVTFRVPGIDPRQDAGVYVEPEDWNALVADPEVTLIDTRNDYEYEVGRFRDAINPATDAFPEFADYARVKLDPRKQRKVAMYCTGGIRCEKATAFLRQQGFAEVYHLKGGILKYLEKIPAEESLWEGDCFVFDNRVAVDHDLAPADWSLCPVCDKPMQERCGHCPPKQESRPPGAGDQES